MHPLKISYGTSCFAKKWSNKTISFDDLCKRLETTVRTSETVEEYPRLPKAERDHIKDKGGYVGGWLKEGRRKRSNVECRSLLTLDADRAAPDFLADYERLNVHASCIYSTHSHVPESPRLRIVIPLRRDVTADEYNAVARFVTQSLGIDQFDECSYRPHQLMYWPSTPSNGEYVFRRFDGEWLDPDAVLAQHPNWRDCSLLPTSSRESEALRPGSASQQDPLGKSGVIGAFCRAYTVEDAIAAFLPDIYEPSAMDGRYDYVPADSSAGVVIYDGKWAYSHHASDPACGKLLNAFDLVRVHRFPDMEEKASFTAMSDFAANDERVNAVLLEERRQRASRDFKDWTHALQRGKNGLLTNNLHNIMLILQNDPALQAIVFNQLADGLEIKGEVPWKHPARFWRDADDAQLISYVDAHYGTFSARGYEIAVTKVADDRSYHPIREYLDNLPDWDGVARIEKLLPIFLGAEDNRYVRAVTRKTLCAAVARVLNPGVKFDYILVLNGPQGVGKSTLISKLGGEWYSDSLSLTDMNDKTAAEKLQGYWLLEIGELAGMRKADIDKVKAFISRQDDKYRASFGRRVTPHPRQCVFFGTTNSEKGYLRDITGNRRFWTVKTPGGGPMRSWQLADADVRQVWAEALCHVRAGETLYLEAGLEAEAAAEQRDAMEQDEREGLVRDYLEVLLPEGWDGMDAYERRSFMSEPDNPTLPKGLVRRDTVSNMEIWCECFGKRKEDMLPKDSYAIAAIMERMAGWEKTETSIRIPIYGKQRIYKRT
jgi:hypothetical protein